MEQSDAEILFAAGVEAARAGDMKTAEQLFRKCLASQPNHAGAAHQLSLLLMSLRAYAEAEPLLRHAIALNPSNEGTKALAILMEATSRDDEAATYYRDILQANPADTDVLMRLAGVCNRLKDRAAASAYFKQAWDIDPSNFQAALGYGVALTDVDPAEAVVVMDRLLHTFGNDDRHCLQILTAMLSHKESHERDTHGLMAAHGTSVNDLFFTYCAREHGRYQETSARLLKQRPDASSALASCMAHLTSRNYREVQTLLMRLQPTMRNNVWEAATFDPAFYRQLEDMTEAEIVAGLPPFIEVTPASFTDAPVFYISCDFAYFAEYAVPLIRSLADRKPGGQVLIHLMDASPEETDRAISVCRRLPALTTSISVERPGLTHAKWQIRRCYYHAIRFVRYYQYRRRFHGALWSLDADALFHDDPNTMLQALHGKDVALRIFPGRFEPWSQFSAAIVGTNATPAAMAYFHLVAGYIAHLHAQDKLRWGVDQLALFGAFAYMDEQKRAPAIAGLTDQMFDQAFRDDGIIWLISGTRKHNRKTSASGNDAPRDPSPQEKYWRLYDSYREPA